ncbi:TPA: restriction endonuclease subunit S [Vibrio cholerae]|uniref:restriction endonuclease subunit S n=1 Tax=Vibrio cholerae TaxID=666 RepID=UPI0004E382DC|nr:restriction endonuclease subunit S [Vibrio cholerae]EGR1074679.1 restriction endonuclease subunit S [Vibrio cholerae]EGR2416261.1 restriction endonuclease subunit S [Vibrio cholerae]EGR2475627.1 restriction endonuclease subunit S [Vibrio cholerae]ELJ8444011.1 restriction endonuclease subunit S [Vibrio cholerae]ELJ8519897.1 restriction endonuclease subunit S [Vibrio cholerae]
MIKPYPNYVRSDIKWVDALPENWKSVPFYTVASESKLSNKGMIEDNLLSLSFGRIKRKSIDTQGGLLPASFETYQIVNENDIIFRLTDLQNDKRSLRSAQCTERGIITSAYVAVTPSSIRSRYLHYLMRAYDETKVFYNLGAGMRQSLKYDELKRLPILLPPDLTQQAIEKFLDRETQRIDSLIEEKQTFITLLKEKRQALISHVVTKGLNPNVEMQDSGIEWIGQVPKHWNITSLKSVSTVVDPNPSHRNPEYVDNGFPFISTKEFTGIDGIELDTLRRVSEDTVIEQEKRCEFREGSIAFSRKGTIGEVRILPHHIRFALLDSVCVINAGDTVSYQYLYLQAKSSVYDSQLGAVVRGAALKQVSVGKVRDLLTLCPPIDEQNQIVTYIDQQLEKLDKLVAETSTSLALLKERRISLISAAVTGKIDVREAV